MLIKVKMCPHKIRVELHTHTKYSHDSILGKWAYLVMLKVRKIDVVAITDHDEIIGAKIFGRFLGRYGIKTIIGQEIMSSQGEIIGLFISSTIPRELPARDTMLEIRRQGGLVYVPHPYDNVRWKSVLQLDAIEENLDLIHIMESSNGRNIEASYSEKQRTLVCRYNKVPATGSDAHVFFELGRNFHIMERFSTPEEFLLQLSRSTSCRSRCLPLTHSITKLVRLIKMLARGDYDEVLRVVLVRFKRIS